MTFIWLIVWLFSSSPPITFSPLNDWAIALIVVAVIDIIGALGKS